MTMTRNAALMVTMGGALAVCLLTIHVFADPFGVKAWLRSVENEPFVYNDPDYLYTQALAYYRNGDQALARDVSRRVLLVSPQSKAAYKLLAASYLKDKDFRRAEDAARSAVKIDPGDVDAQLGIATALRGQGLNDAAITAYEAVMQNKLTAPAQQEAVTQTMSELREKSGAAKEKGATP